MNPSVGCVQPLKKKILLIIGVWIASSTAIQMLSFGLVYRGKMVPAASCKALLVYGGVMGRSVEGLSLANKAHVPLFISDSFGGPKDFEQKIGLSHVPVTVDHFARTTDQNARNAVKFLKKGNYQKALLVTSWFHMPRALFLTRLYLIGSGITVDPAYFESIPSHYWTNPDFWAEIVRFWGSLGRVALAFFGFQKPWFHS